MPTGYRENVHPKMAYKSLDFDASKQIRRQILLVEIAKLYMDDASLALKCPGYDCYTSVAG